MELTVKGLRDLALQTWRAAACCMADVMGETHALTQPAIDWSALKHESLHNFTLLNSAILSCVSGGVGGNGDSVLYQPSWR